MNQSTSEQERRRLIAEQDAEYNTALKATQDETELQFAKIIALSIEEKESMELEADLEEIRQMELQTEKSLQLNLQTVPVLVYPVLSCKKEDMYTLRFKLPNSLNNSISKLGKSSVVEYCFDRKEPMLSVENTIKFVLQCTRNIQLLIPIRQKIHYTSSTSIQNSGIKNKSMIIVELM